MRAAEILLVFLKRCHAALRRRAAVLVAARALLGWSFLLEAVVLGLLVFGLQDWLRALGWVLFLLLGIRCWRSRPKAAFARFAAVRAATAVEELVPDAGRLVSAAEFAFENDGDGLKAAHLEEVVRRLPSGPPLPDRRPLRRLMLVQGVALCFAACGLLAVPADAGRALAFLFGMPPADIAAVLAYPETLIAGAPFQLLVQTGATRADLHVVHDGQRFARRLESGTNGFVFRLPRVERELSFSLDLHRVGRRRRFPERRVRILREPFLDSLRFRLEFPPWQGRPAQTVEAVPFLEVPQGTRIVIDGLSGVPLASAALVETNRFLPLVADGAAFRGAVSATTNRSFHFQLVSRDSLTNRNPVTYRLLVAVDHPPRLVLHAPLGESAAPRTLEVPFVYEASDDGGLAAVRLEYGIRVGERWRMDRQMMPIPDGRGQVTRWVWDMNPLPLAPGMEVRARVAALDRGGQRAESDWVILRLPTLASLLGEVRQRDTEIGRQLEDLVREARRSSARLAQADREMERTRGVAQAERPSQAAAPAEGNRRELEALRKRIGEEQQALGRAEQALREQEAALTDRRLLSPETLDKVREVRRYLQELRLERRERLLPELERLLSANTPADLSRYKNMEEEMSRSLDAMLGALRQLARIRTLEEMRALAQAMREETARLQAGLRRQDPADEATPGYRALETNAQALSVRQQALEREAASAAQKDADTALRQELARLGAAQAAREAEAAQRRGDPSAARARLDGLDQGLEKLAARLAELAAREAGDDLRRLKTALEPLVFDMFALTDWARQELAALSLLRQHFAPASPAFRRRAHALLSGFGDLEKAVAVKQREYEALVGSTVLARQLPAPPWRGLRDSLAVLIDCLQNLRIPELIRAEQQPAPLFHQVILRLLGLLEALDRRGPEAPAGGGAGQAGDSLSSLAEAQRRLDAKLTRLQGRAGSGQLTAEDGRELAMLALEQQAIREALETAAERGDSGGGMRQGLGDLARELREIESRLKKGELTRELVEREQRVLGRMLQASRALREQGERDERKAETAETEQSAPSGSIPQVPPAVREALRRFRSGGRTGMSSQEYRLVERYYRLLLER